MDQKKLFPGLPPDLASLSVEELNELLKSYREVAQKLGNRDPEAMGDLTMAQVLEQFQGGVEEIEKITAEIDARGEIDAEFEGQLGQLVEKAGVKAEGGDDTDDGPEEPEDDGAVSEPEVTAEAEPEVVEVVDAATLEPVAASAKFDRKPALPRPSEEHQPVDVGPDAMPGFVASAGVTGFAEGMVLDRKALARAIIVKREGTTSTPKGVTENVIVASVNYGDQWPDERKLLGDARDQEKIDALVSPEALTASGGLCAPVSNYYEIRNWSTPARPVRGALVGMNAVRGGLKFTQGITFAEIDIDNFDDTGGVGIRTAAQDAAGGTSADKSCQVIECPDFDEVQLDTIYKCLQFGNLNTRAWPEMVAAFSDAASSAHAALAETNVLDQMIDWSTAVDGNEAYGSFSSLLYSIILGAEGIRSRHRLADSTVIRSILPRWTVGLLIADLINSNFYRFEKTREGVVQALRDLANVEVTFTLDSGTGEGQVMTAQAAGAQNKFPTTVKFLLYPEGSFLHLDGGTLDLGIVRDSALNNTNDYRLFAETWEVVAFIGIESQYITTTVCPTGAGTPNASALITC